MRNGAEGHQPFHFLLKVLVPGKRYWTQLMLEKYRFTRSNRVHDHRGSAEIRRRTRKSVEVLLYDLDKLFANLFIDFQRRDLQVREHFRKLARLFGKLTRLGWSGCRRSVCTEVRSLLEVGRLIMVLSSHSGCVALR